MAWFGVTGFSMWNKKIAENSAAIEFLLASRRADIVFSVKSEIMYAVKLLLLILFPQNETDMGQEKPKIRKLK
jgi:hypothetical protein